LDVYLLYLLCLLHIILEISHCTAYSSCSPRNVKLKIFAET